MLVECNSHHLLLHYCRYLLQFRCFVGIRMRMSLVKMLQLRFCLLSLMSVVLGGCSLCEREMWCVQEVRRFETKGTTQEVVLSKAKVKSGLVALWFAVTASIENRTFFFFCSEAHSLTPSPSASTMSDTKRPHENTQTDAVAQALAGTLEPPVLNQRRRTKRQKVQGAHTYLTSHNTLG